MKTKIFENGLAVAGALLVLVAVSTAANSALADEVTPAATAINTMQTATDTSLAIAESAVQAATSDAIDAIISDNQMALDIRMLDRTTPLVAGS